MSDDNLVALGGCHHTSQGRWLGGGHRIAADLWRPPEPSIEPIHHLVAGAGDYARATGLRGYSHEDYSGITRDPEDIRKVGEAYDAMPEHDQKAHAAYARLRDEVNRQHDHLTGALGIKVEHTDHDPYPDVHAMRHDVANNGRLKVLKTSVTGGHPLFSDEENDKFRAVHDAFGHLATGRGFDRHGEQAAWMHHSQMFTPLARHAATTELKGQNSSLILNGKFPEQKVGLLPKHMVARPGEGNFALASKMVKSAYGETKAPADVDTLRDQECPVCGESDAYDGDKCQVCGFIKPPAMFLDPNLDVAKQIDLRKQVADDLNDPNDLNEDGVPDSIPGQEPFPQPGAMGGDVQDPSQDPTNAGAGPGQGDPNALTDAAGDPAMTDNNGNPVGQELSPGAMPSPDDEDDLADPDDPNLLGGSPKDGQPQESLGPELDPATGLPLDETQMQSGDPTLDGQDPAPEANPSAVVCPNCGFSGPASQPMSTSTDPMAAGDVGDGMLAGDVCPNCGQATLMSQGEMDQSAGVAV